MFNSQMIFDEIGTKEVNNYEEESSKRLKITQDVFVSVEMIDADRAATFDIATVADVEKRLREQDEKYVERLRSNEVTPQWKAYALKRSLQINEAMTRGKKETR